MARTSKYVLNHEVLSTASAMWKAGLYLRLSKEDGDKYESDSICNQRLIIEDYLKENPEIRIEDIYSDDDYTGVNFNRPGFQRLIEDIKTGKINCVVVKDLSRFGRNYIEAGQYLQIFFPVMEVRFIAITDMIDSFIDPNSVNSCMVSFKNVMNEEVCRDISLKVRSSLSSKRENGEYLGACPYGYKKAFDNKNKLIIDEEAAQTVKMIFKLFLEGNSLFAIAKKLSEIGIPNPSKHKKLQLQRKKNSGLWSVQTVRHILTHRMLTGDMVQGIQEKISYKIDKLRKVKEENWIVVENTHEAIIDKITFNNVQTMLKRDTRVSHKTKELGLFSGFLKCADCGMLLQRKYKLRTNGEISYAYFICRTYNTLKKDACTRHYIRADVLEKTVLEVITKYIDVSIEMSDLITQINKSPKKKATTVRIETAIKNKEGEQAKIEAILLDLYPDLKCGLINQEQYLALKARYETEIEKVRKSLNELKGTYENEKSGINRPTDLLQTFLEFRNIKSLSREILITLVDSIVVHEGGKIEIIFKFRDVFEKAAKFIEVNREILIGKASCLIDRINDIVNGVAEAL